MVFDITKLSEDQLLELNRRVVERLQFTPPVMHQMITTLAPRGFIMREAGMFDDDVISGAADATLFERARALLLGGARGSR